MGVCSWRSIYLQNIFISSVRSPHLLALIPCPCWPQEATTNFYSDSEQFLILCLAFKENHAICAVFISFLRFLFFSEVLSRLIHVVYVSESEFCLIEGHNNISFCGYCTLYWLIFLLDKCWVVSALYLSWKMMLCYSCQCNLSRQPSSLNIILVLSSNHIRKDISLILCLTHILQTKHFLNDLCYFALVRISAKFKAS